LGKFSWSPSYFSKHVKQLKEAGYVKQRKEKVNGLQGTWLYLTEERRVAFTKHVAELIRIVQLTGL
jgi:DNA-binding MarR family transcriptional regulator